MSKAPTRQVRLAHPAEPEVVWNAGKKDEAAVALNWHYALSTLPAI